MPHDWTNDLRPIMTKLLRAEYERGWADAFKHIAAVAANPSKHAQPPLPLGDSVAAASTGDGERAMIDVVRELITASPGLRGTGIVEAIHTGNPNKDRKSMDRTIRTALARLKKRGLIEQRGGKWFPPGGA